MLPLGPRGVFEDFRHGNVVLECKALQAKEVSIAALTVAGVVHQFVVFGYGLEHQVSALAHLNNHNIALISGESH